VRVHPFYLLLGALALGGCASAPAPIEQMRLADQALDQARAVGATEDTAEFKLAVEKITQARSDMADKAFKAARLQAEQAELDARVAEAKVLTQKSQDQLAASNVRIDRLRKQLQEGQ
jgi:phage gp16-like protein